MTLKRIAAALAVLVLGTASTTGCAPAVEGVSHRDYGYCQRSVRHKHNDHVFLGDFHDHSLCEWEKFN